MNSKRISEVCLAVLVLCLISRYVFCYLSGYTGYFGSLALLWLIAWSLQFLSFVFLLWGLMRSIKLGKNKTKMLVLITLFCCVIGSNMLAPAPEMLIMRGLREGLLRHESLDEIRRFAQDFDRTSLLSSDENYLSNKTYLYEDLIKAGFVGKYPFLKRLSHPTVIEESNVVYVSGGRPLRGVFVT